MQKQGLIDRTWAPLSASVVLEPLDPQTRLALTTHVTLTRQDGVVRKLDLGGKTAALDADSGQQITALLARLDGATSLAEASTALGWELADTVEAAQDLYQLAVLENAGDTAIGANAFFQHVSALGRGIQARIGESADLLLSQLMTGRPHRRLLLGYLVEFYHIVIRASLHIAPTIAHAPNERLRMLLSEYLGDEYWHGLWLRKGLVAAGLTEAEIERSDPLPATLAALDRLRSDASTDLLAYAASISTGEGDGDKEMARVRRRYDRLLSHGLLPAEAVAPFRDHELADCAAGHYSYCAEIFAEAAPLTRQHQDSVRRSMLSYLRALEEQQRQIQRFYGDETGPAMYTSGWVPPPAPALNPNLTPAEVSARLGDERFFVYDCCTVESYREAHVPGAVWLDFDAITARALPDDLAATLLFYCSGESCTACERGANRARQLGYHNVFVMRAGLAGWQATRAQEGTR